MRPSTISRVPCGRLCERSHTLVTPIPAEPAQPRTWLGETCWGQSPSWLPRSGPEATRASACIEGARPPGTNSLRAMQHAQALDAQDLDLDLDVIRPWRRATIAV